MLPIWSFPYRQEIAQNLSFHESVLTVMKQVTDQAGISSKILEKQGDIILF